MILTISTVISILLVVGAIIYISPASLENLGVPGIIDSKKEGIHQETAPTKYRIPIDGAISQVSWYDNQNLIIQDNRDIKLFNIMKREEKDLIRIMEYEHVRFGNQDSSELCIWENKVKETPEDTGTVIRVIKNQKEIKKLEIPETVKVDECGNRSLIASNAFDFMQTSLYKIDINTGKIAKDEERIEESSPFTWKQLQGNLTVKESSKTILSTPFMEQVKDIKVADNRKNFLVKTDYGNWIISKQ